MKICFVVGYYPRQVGGAELQAKIIAEELVKRGHEVVYIAYGLSEHFKDMGIEIWNVQSKKIDKLFGYHIVNRKICLLLNKIEPNLIYHRCFVPYSYGIIKFASKKGIPCYFHIAGDSSITFDNSLFGRFRKRMFLKIRKLAVNFIFQTQEQYELVQTFGITKYKIIGNLQNIPDIRLQISKEHKIVWIGKSTAIKQLHKFVNLAEECARRKLPLQFVVISRFLADKYSYDLLNRMESIPNICNLGERSNDFINDFLQKDAYLLVNTSVSEGISNTYIQAWARGVPVISLNSNPNKCFDKYNVGICCHGDENVMYESIIKYCTNMPLYKESVRTSISYAKETFSIDEVLSKLLNYMEI